MQIGKKISQLRKMSGLSQEQFAEKMDVSRQTISKWENGASVPDWESMIKISCIFSITLDELAENEDDAKSEKQSMGLTLQDLIKINASNRRKTILLMAAIELMVISILSVIVIAIINDATLSIQYMLYRYIVVTDYNNVLFADYHTAYLFAGTAGILSVILFCIYHIRGRVKTIEKSYIS